MHPDLINELPSRCVDPVVKYCQGCPYGWVRYPAWVETSADLEGCSFESGCKLGFDIGRPEDEPTPEELAEFYKWCEGLSYDTSGSAYDL